MSKKPMEWNILDGGLEVNGTTRICLAITKNGTDKFTGDKTWIAREVVPIDWEKIWSEIDRLAVDEISGCNDDTRRPIQQLVEAQLKGDK